MHMRVPFLGTRVVLKNCVFHPLCYCSDTLLDVHKPTKLGFQSLGENILLWWLSFLWFYTRQYFYRSATEAVLQHTLLYCTKLTIFPVTSLSETGVFVSIRIWLNLWFSHFSFFQCYGKNYLVHVFLIENKGQLLDITCKLSIWANFCMRDHV